MMMRVKMVMMMMMMMMIVFDAGDGDDELYQVEYVVCAAAYGDNMATALR